MNRPAVIIPVIIIINSCIWAFAILMSSHKLSETGAYEQIQNILVGCAGASLVVVGGCLAGLGKKLKSKE